MIKNIYFVGHLYFLTVFSAFLFLHKNIYLYKKLVFGTENGTEWWGGGNLGLVREERGGIWQTYNLTTHCYLPNLHIPAHYPLTYQNTTARIYQIHFWGIFLFNENPFRSGVSALPPAPGTPNSLRVRYLLQIRFSHQEIVCNIPRYIIQVR